MVLDILIGEAARTVVGSTLGYFVGKWFGSRSKAERCRFLWKLEFEVSPRILRDVIEQEVKAGCISRDEMDDRLYKIMQVRAKYGLGYGADVFASASKSGNRLDVRASAVPPSSPPSEPKTPEQVIKKEFAQAKAMQEVGPPSFLRQKKKGFFK